MRMSDSEQRLTYYKPAWLNLMWGELAGDKGCAKLDRPIVLKFEI